MEGKSYLTVANEPGMWLAASLVVLVAVAQAFIFMFKAYRTGIAMGIPQQKLYTSIRSGVITSIGPSFAVVIAMVSLIVSLGGPIAWMRLSVIGSVPFELMAAAAGAEAMGTTLGGVGYDLTAYANSVWTCTLGATGWLLICGLLTHRFEDLRKFVVKGNEKLLPILSISAMIGAFAYFSAPYMAKDAPNLAACLAGAASMIILNLICNRYQLNALKEWSLGIAMLIGMFVSLLFI